MRPVLFPNDIQGWVPLPGPWWEAEFISGGSMEILECRHHCRAVDRVQVHMDQVEVVMQPRSQQWTNISTSELEDQREEVVFPEKGRVWAVEEQLARTYIHRWAQLLQKRLHSRDGEGGGTHSLSHYPLTSCQSFPWAEPSQEPKAKEPK